jgi:ABC-type transporter Mla maintaining outer membrane lipid asymmetry ATPase subunit MlaF
VTGGALVLEMHQVSKSYGALRPLRIAALTVAQGERVSIGGVDAGAGELLVNLVTGASLPDSGDVRVFGQSTRSIADGEAWLASLERFGIVSPRAVLLEGSTLAQNLAMAFTLEIDPIPAGVMERVRRLAVECGMEGERWLGTVAGALPGDVRVLAHLARSLALDPEFLVIEHPTAGVDPRARQPLAASLERACRARGITALVMTNDDVFGRLVAPRNLTLHGASGELKPLKKGWFSR